MGLFDEIVLFGDSITQQGYSSGWVSFLSDAYVRRLRVVNVGLSGYNTEQALRVLPRIIPAPGQSHVRLFTVFFGANDARIPNHEASPQHVPLTTYRDNLRKIVTHAAVQAHEPRILLMTPPPVDEGVFGAQFSKPELHRSATQTAEYVEAVRQVGKELHIPVLDVWMAFLKQTRWREGEPLPGSRERRDPALSALLSDGLHLSPQGNQLVFEELMRLITKTWPELIPENVTTTLPLWDDVDAWQKYE